jgi:hypothetical protein
LLTEATLASTSIVGIVSVPVLAAMNAPGGAYAAIGTIGAAAMGTLAAARRGSH